MASTYASGFAGLGVGYPYSYLISRTYLIVDKWNRLSTPNGDLISFNSEDDDDVENFIRHRIADLLLDRPRWDTVLALDFSDTMNESVTLAGVTKTKSAFLRDAVDLCLRVWKDYALGDDQVGLVRFNNAAYTDAELQPILPGDNVETISDAVAAATATGCTAMGAGIATAFDILETALITAGDPHKRHVIVFTDGIQNRNPMVWRTADCGGGSCTWQPQIRDVPLHDIELMGDFLCINGADGGDSGYAGTLPRIIHGNPMQTAIHSIAIGAPDFYQGLLNVISDETSGLACVDTDIWPNLEEFFVESMMQTLRGFTLGVVAKASGTLEGSAEHVEVFRLNRSVRSATILLSWVDESAPLTFELRKDGELISVQHKQTVRPAASITTLPFPLYQPPRSLTIRERPRMSKPVASSAAWKSQEGPAQAPELDERVLQMRLATGHLVDAQGEYTVTVRRMFADTSQSTPFHLMVLADDHKVEVALHLPKPVFFTDERIPLTLTAIEHGRPVPAVFSATAVVKDMLHNEAIGKKLRARTKETVRLERAFPRGQKLAAEAGSYRARYSTTNVPGHYRVEARVRGVSPTAGVFERLVSRTVLVLPRPSLDHSKLKVAQSGKQHFTLNMTPADRHGNLLGPGFGSQIQFLLDDEPSGVVRDKQDASYQLNFDLQENANRSPSATLWVLGEKVFSGSLSKLVESFG